MSFIFIFEETRGTCNYFRTKKWFTHLRKREEPDVPEAVIQEIVKAVQERRLQLPDTELPIQHCITE
jgi:hypothetical protein